MFDLDCAFHVADDSPLRDVGTALEALRPYAQWLGEHDPSLSHWFLGGESLSEAQQYEAFADGGNGHHAATAVLRTESGKSRAPVVFLWNGEDNDAGASLVLSVSDSIYPTNLTLSLHGSADTPREPWGDYRLVASLVSKLAQDLSPACCTVYRQSAYFKHMVYKDRPGVGWMLYLPRVLSVQDVPEARAVLPVMKDDKQLGTILVSVIDGVFTTKNPEHLKVARDIETRLVSNDWLPTWAQLTRH